MSRERPRVLLIDDDRDEVQLLSSRLTNAGYDVVVAATLKAAIAHPRVHVDTSGDPVKLKAEAGLDLPDVDLPVTEFPGPVMYFGGVGAAVYDDAGGFDVAADPRREGGVFNPGTC